MWFRKPARRRKRTRASSVTQHYLTHKAAARELILSRLMHYNAHYAFMYRRVAIRNTRRSWGSCSSLKNLNFSYKILFLPPHLQDYIIIHELCHLAELNHGPQFWDLVAVCAPAHQEHVHELRAIDKTVGARVTALEALRATYPEHENAPRLPQV